MDTQRHKPRRYTPWHTPISLYAALACILFLFIPTSRAQDATDAISRAITLRILTPADLPIITDAVSRVVVIDTSSLNHAITDAVSRAVVIKVLTSADNENATDAISRSLTIKVLTSADTETPTDAISRFLVVRSFCLSDFNDDGGTDGTDIEAFFAAWELGDPISDVNVDGGIDGSDVETFFFHWSNGC
jgi:hypothetical protein